MNTVKRIQVVSFLPRVSTILFSLLFICAVWIGPRMMNMDGDLGRHLTVGNYILTHASIPTRDLFSYTMQGQPFTPHEWLSEVLFALAFRALGFNGVVVLSALLIATTFWLIFKEMIRREMNLLVSLGLIF